MGDSGIACIGALIAIGFLLIVVLVPLSFSYLDYWDYGLKQRKSTSSVSLDRTYEQGRHHLGPDFRFVKYQADAHLESLEALTVFSAGSTNSSIGLEFDIDVDYTYLLRPEKIGQLHRESASSYRTVIKSRVVEAIRNEAIFISFEQYFRDRKTVEMMFRKAVQKSWESSPPVHATLDQFHLGRIKIPETVAERQLESRVQNERNDKEGFLQQAQIEREQTAVEVNRIGLETKVVLRTANAEARLLRSNANAEARQLTSNAVIDGTKRLMEAAGIQDQERAIALSYIRTLTDHSDVSLSVSYLSDANTVKTAAVV